MLPSKSTIELLIHVHNVTLHGFHDQAGFYWFLGDHGYRTKVNFQTLPVHLFTTGNQLFYSKINLRHLITPYVAHFNWVKQQEFKKPKMKLLNCWFLEERITEELKSILNQVRKQIDI